MMEVNTTGIKKEPIDDEEKMDEVGDTKSTFLEIAVKRELDGFLSSPTEMMGDPNDSVNQEEVKRPILLKTKWISKTKDIKKEPIDDEEDADGVGDTKNTVLEIAIKRELDWIQSRDTEMVEDPKIKKEYKKVMPLETKCTPRIEGVRPEGLQTPPHSRPSTSASISRQQMHVKIEPLGDLVSDASTNYNTVNYFKRSIDVKVEAVNFLKKERKLSEKQRAGDEVNIVNITDHLFQVESEGVELRSDDTDYTYMSVQEEDISPDTIEIKSPMVRLETSFNGTCDHCEQPFHSKQALQMHLLEHDLGRGSDVNEDDTEITKKCYLDIYLTKFQCNVCPKIYLRKSDLKVHMRIHTTQDLFKCNVCMKHFIRNSDLKVHMRMHTGEKPFQCDICEKRFGLKGNLKIHMSIHNGDLFRCEICKKKYRRKDYLRNHMNLHKNERPFKCDICDKSFYRKDLLYSHMGVHTVNNKLYECDICGTKLSYKKGLLVHMKTHTVGKPFKCNICNKQFNQKRYLQTHAKTHTGQSSFRCNICRHTFTRKNNLKAHMKIHSEEATKCGICDRTFHRKSAFNSHMITHTQNKPFECVICGQKTTTKKSLLVHMCIHSGEKPFECDICEKKFNQKRYLLAHVRTHTGEKLHECDICYKKFSKTRYLKRHLRTHIVHTDISS